MDMVGMIQMYLRACEARRNYSYTLRKVARIHRGTVELWSDYVCRDMYVGRPKTHDPWVS